ncbi:MAG: phosphoenolpyruvate carboxylase [Candidatus Thorarchaeota archaeon]
MSTQHPDNVNAPFFSNGTEISGEEEIFEAYYAFSHLACDEQMWDYEGKENDNYVIKKLVTKYPSYFNEKRLGRDVFITYRVPNPTVEKGEAKLLLETLASIPRSFDASNIVYKDKIAPIFEVILPMTTSSRCLNRVYHYYKNFIVGLENQPFIEGDITIADWIGKFLPNTINVIPLIEDMASMSKADLILKEYLSDKKVESQRIFLARSDPAMNYGLISAVLINKIALQRIYKLSQRISIDIYPIVGVGSAPFRGNLRPETVKRVANEYPYTHTFTIQSAFKYDNTPEDVMNAIKFLRQRKRTKPREVDELKCFEIINKYSNEYAKQINTLAPIINKVAESIPSRRKRKLHIGLFGYSRNFGDFTLPRAIGFTAALYSIGVPPEILGLNILTDNDLDLIRKIYINFEEDLKDAVKFLNPKCEYIPKGILKRLKELSIDVPRDEIHKRNSDLVIESIKKNNFIHISEYILSAANQRKFLG